MIRVSMAIMKARIRDPALVGPGTRLSAYQILHHGLVVVVCERFRQFSC